MTVCGVAESAARACAGHVCEVRQRIRFMPGQGQSPAIIAEVTGMICGKTFPGDLQMLRSDAYFS